MYAIAAITYVVSRQCCCLCVHCRYYERAAGAPTRRRQQRRRCRRWRRLRRWRRRRWRDHSMNGVRAAWFSYSPKVRTCNCIFCFNLAQYIIQQVSGSRDGLFCYATAAQYCMLLPAPALTVHVKQASGAEQTRENATKPSIQHALKINQMYCLINWKISRTRGVYYLPKKSPLPMYNNSHRNDRFTKFVRLVDDVEEPV